MEQFREGYERHARLAQKLAGHLLVKCVRNYNDGTWGNGTPTTHDGSGGFGPIEWGYDCIAKIYYRDEEAFNENNRIFADPALGKQFYEDEEDFLDRNLVVMFRCHTVETAAGGAVRTL
jgi:hypothetical protein